MDKEKLGNMPLKKLILYMAIPMVLAQLVNLLYNLVDRIYVGRIPEVGTMALTGLGVAFPIIILISAFGGLVGSGGGTRVAIALGEKKYDKAEKILGNSFLLLVFFSVICLIVFYIFKDPLLIFFGASENSLPYASSYLGIYLIGTLSIMVTLSLNMFITSQGFTKVSMITVIIGCIANIILDPIFIFGFNMGVEGAALASVISQTISAIFVIVFLCSKKSIIRLKFSQMKINFKIIGAIVAIGISTFVMQATESLIQLVFNKGMQTYGNDYYIALMTIMFSSMQMIMLPLMGFCQGVQPVISYNYGAKNIDRVKKTFWIMFKICLGYSLVVIGLIEVFPTLIIRIFTDDINVIGIGAKPMRIFLMGISLMGAQIACQQTFVALGRAKTSLFLAMLRKIILLIPLAIIIPLVTDLGVYGLYIAEAISDIMAITVTIVLFISTRKKLFVVPNEEI